MEIVKTIVCKLKVSKKNKEILLKTMELFRDACNYISEIAWKQKCFNPVALHHLTYRKVREKFKLPANLAIEARDRVAKSYKTDKSKLHEFKSLSMDLDDRLFSIKQKEDKFLVSIATIKGRIKCELDIGDYQRQYLENAKPTYATLHYRNKTFFLHIAIDKEIPEPKGSNPVGVDVGIKHLLVASNGFKVKGGKIVKQREHFRKLRQELQKKRTWSAYRKLKQISGKEKRWINTILHQISREFVDSLKEGDVVVMEKLNGIRERVKLRKEQRYFFHSWAFRKLQQYIEYKALERGIPVVYVNAKNTSITCPRCGYVEKRNRRTQSLFRCVKCGFQHNADMVGALNLANKFRSELARAEWGVVNRPNAGMNAMSFCEHHDSPANHSFLTGGG
ncbi:MAG: transposase [Candidatus Aenigmatarchaeota archaeon]|nr:MAG: transposase [Candidatus Aenigmarchaeota archaeon]